MASVPYKQLAQKHPSYDAQQWRLQRALATGGRDLLGNRALLQKVIPQAINEPDDRYERRLARGFFASPAGSIIEALAAGLFADPLRFTPENAGAEAPYYEGLMLDCSPPGGVRQSINEVLRQVVTDALVCGGVGYAFIDFPGLPEGYEPPVTRAHSEALGMAHGYICPVDPLQVIDWEVDKSGALSLAVIMTENARRTSFTSGRDEAVIAFHVMSAKIWQRWELKYSRRAHPMGPSEDAPVTLVAAGEHSFGRVPLLRLELDRGLRAMDKMYSLAMAHADVTNLCRIAASRAMWPMPVAFYADSDPTGAEPAPGVIDERYTSRPTSQYDTMAMRAGDKFEYVGPDAAPIGAGFKVAEDIERSMYAVMHSMALNADPRSAAALSRSGESKAQDRLAQSIVLRALGQIVREFAARVLETLRTGRGDDQVTFTIKGLENFDATSVPELLGEATQVSLLEIPSPAFQTAHKLKVAKSVLGEDATPELMAQIKAELERGEATDHTDPGAGAAITAAVRAQAAALEAGEPDPPPAPKPHELGAAGRRKARREARVNGA